MVKIRPDRACWWLLRSIYINLQVYQVYPSKLFRNRKGPQKTCQTNPKVVQQIKQTSQKNSKTLPNIAETSPKHHQKHMIQKIQDKSRIAQKNLQRISNCRAKSTSLHTEEATRLAKNRVRLRVSLRAPPGHMFLP